jgi:hypothetical protein
MRDTIHTLARRVVAAAAVAVLFGTAACSEGPTAPGATPVAKASASLAKQQKHTRAGQAGGKRRAGYNVVAD